MKSYFRHTQGSFDMPLCGPLDKLRTSGFRTMNSSRAFTIIELLIALFLSSFIMLGMMQAYRNAITSLGAVRAKMAITRKGCLLFNELERDFSSMLVPFLNKEIVPDKDKDQKSQVSDKKDPDLQASEKKESGDKKTDDSGDKTKQDEQQESLKNSLHVQVYEDESRRIGGKKFTLFKSINFITTHPLQVYGDKRLRLVRVVYELVRNKQKSTRDQVCYNLFRKETTDLMNFKMKEDEEAAAKNKQASIRTYLVTDNVKEMYLELITEKVKEEKSKDNKQEIEEVRLFVWGEKDFTVGVVPKSLEMRIVIWDDQLKRTQAFQIFVPVFSYPTEHPKNHAQDLKVPAADKKSDEQQKTGMQITGVNQTAPGVYNSVGRAQ